MKTSPLIFPIAMMLTGAAGLGYFAHDLPVTGIASYASAQVSPYCSIKGNISFDTGERIYHMPGQAYYNETRISHSHGERWFCSEAEARAAGWRKAKEPRGCNKGTAQTKDGLKLIRLSSC